MKSTLRAAAGGALLTILSSVSANAIVIQGTNTADTLAQQLFLNTDSITILDSQLTFGEPGGGGGEFEDFCLEVPDDPECEGFEGGPALLALEPDPDSTGFIPSTQQAGTYINVGGTYGLPSPGIVLSTGDVLDYASGPNTDSGLTGGDGTGATASQNDLLGEITGKSQHFDPVQLDIEFNVDAGVDEISFIGVFGSEEYPEFVGSSFNDGFGLFVNGVNVAGALQTGAAPGSTPLPINIDHPDMQPVVGTELDGVLAPNNIPLLRFDVPVNEGVNVFTVILADASDSALDTTVYLSSFGDFSSTNGSSEFTPVLPSNPPDENGTFVIELPDVTEGATIWIDPPVSVGFTYEATNAEFATITAPSLLTVNDPDGFELVINGTTYSIMAGQTFDIVAETGGTVTEFVLQGIDPALMLDPANPVAFPLGVSLLNITGTVTVDMTPITENINGVTPVPVPAAGALYLLGLAGVGGLMRRRSKARA